MSSKKAVDWVERAKAFFKATGKEISCAEFNNPRGQFVQSQHYIFVLSLTGEMLAHGMNYFFAGKNFIEVKDSKGKAFVREIVETAKQKGSGWTEYVWYDPVIKKELPKNLYFERFEDVIICCGTYKEAADISDLELL